LQFIHFFGEEEPFVVELGIAHVDELFLHEEIVPEALNRLINSLKRSNVQSDPIIVDKKSNVVLDGTHRVSAFREMGYPYILVAYVDYNHRMIELKRWFRVLNGPEEALLDALRDVDYERINATRMDSVSLDDKIAVIRGDDIFIIETRGDVFEKYSILRRFEKKLVRNGVKIDYITEHEAIDFWSKGKTILSTPRITKHDVVIYARQSKVFPPKSTRHVFPLRPIFVNFPLHLLRSPNMNVDTLREVLREYLLERVALKIEGRVVIDRFYEENYLLVFI